MSIEPNEDNELGKFSILRDQYHKVKEELTLAKKNLNFSKDSSMKKKMDQLKREILKRDKEIEDLKGIKGDFKDSSMKKKIDLLKREILKRD